MNWWKAEIGIENLLKRSKMTAGKFYGYAGFANGVGLIIFGVVKDDSGIIFFGLFLIVCAFFAVQDKS